MIIDLVEVSQLDERIREKEDQLRSWFVQGSSRIQQVIDGIDIGWKGAARWATAHINKTAQDAVSPQILDVACGYGTFLAELGWRFPSAELYGLNLDFRAPHNIIFELLKQAGVNANLVIADAINLPFPAQSFDFTTCFLGLQDIEITRGLQGICKTLDEMLRVVRPTGYIVLIDNFPATSYESWLTTTSRFNEIVVQDSFEIKCRWNREVGEAAVHMYAEGTLMQLMDQKPPPADPEKALEEIHRKLQSELEKQLAEEGYYNPWGRMNIVIAKPKPVSENYP